MVATERSRAREGRERLGGDGSVLDRARPRAGGEGSLMGRVSDVRASLNSAIQPPRTRASKEA